MKTSPIFSNSSEPEAGILQESQPQDKVLGATVGSSLDSRILKSELVMERKEAFLHLQQCVLSLLAMHCARQPIAVSDISIYIYLINIRSKSKEQLNVRRAGLSTLHRVTADPRIELPMREQCVTFQFVAEL